MPVQTKLEKVTIARDVIAGLKKRLVPGQKYRVGGHVYERDELIACYEQHLAALERISQAWAAWQEALVAERKLRRPMSRLTLHLKTWVLGSLGPGPLGDFGWDAPKKPGPKTVKAKLAGVEKRRKNRR